MTCCVPCSPCSTFTIRLASAMTCPEKLQKRRSETHTPRASHQNPRCIRSCGAHFTEIGHRTLIKCGNICKFCIVNVSRRMKKLKKKTAVKLKSKVERTITIRQLLVFGQNCGSATHHLTGLTNALLCRQFMTIHHKRHHLQIKFNSIQRGLHFWDIDKFKLFVPTWLYYTRFTPPKNAKKRRISSSAPHLVRGFCSRPGWSFKLVPIQGGRGKFRTKHLRWLHGLHGDDFKWAMKQTLVV